jgi:hypothetical protein
MAAALHVADPILSILFIHVKDLVVRRLRFHVIDH